MSRPLAFMGAAALAISLASTSSAQSVGGDIILSDIQNISSFGPVGGIRAYVLGSGTCNIGDQNLEWNSSGSPGIGMNAFRLHDGRLMQIGIGNPKTACCVINTGGCSMTCMSGGTGLRAGCKDTYSSSFNSNQQRLAPRSAINAYTGAFSGYPAITGDAIFRRLQIQQSDLEPANFPGALYFVEGVYVSTGDAQAQNWHNNATYQRVTLNATFQMFLAEAPFPTIPAIYAWRDHGNGVNVPDPTVEIINVDVPDEGRFVVANKVRDNGDGTWRYDYAIYNLNSHRSGASLTVPVPNEVTVTDIGFNDVDYHSDEIYDNTDWTMTRLNDSVQWASPQTHDQNPNTNALRWGTMYNFWFTADSPPEDVQATMGMFRTGTPDSVTFVVQGPLPGLCRPDIAPPGGDGTVGVADLLAVINAWGPCGDPKDCPQDIAPPGGDGFVGVQDLLAVINGWGPCP